MRKYTLITGASSGLAKELSKLYAKDNNNLVLVDINDEGLLLTKKEIEKLNPNIDIKTIKANLSDLDDCEKVYIYTLTNEIFINNLVNAAGFGDRCDFKDMEIEKQIKMNHLNCDAVLYFTRKFIDNMLKYNEGHIINVSSIAGFISGPYMSTYHATKGYVLLLGESISYELKKTNVHLLTLCPGPFNSNFTSVAHNEYTFKKIKPSTSEEVALFAYKKSLKNKTLAIKGFKNKLSIFSSRFFSRKFVTKVSAKKMKKDA